MKGPVLQLDFLNSLLETVPKELVSLSSGDQLIDYWLHFSD